MRSGQSKYREKIVFLLLILLSLIFLITYVFLISYFNETKKGIYSDYIEKLKDEYNITIDGYTEMADLIFQNSINTEQVLQIMEKGIDSESEIEKNSYRNELYDELTVLYKNMVNFNFRQMHFQEKDNRSFLRFHKKDKYGDNLTGIRFSVEYVNKTGKKISGFEEGRIFNGYRNVYPLIYQGRQLGSMEMSISMSAIVKQLESRVGQQSQFILLKSVVDKKVFESELSNYTDWSVDDDFVLDSNIADHCIIEGSAIESDFKLIRESLTESRKRNEPFAIRISINNEKVVLAFLPIINFEEKTVAYIFSISDDTNIHKHQRSFRIITFTFLSLMFFSLFFMLYVSITNRKIQNMIQFDLLTGAYTRRLIFSKLEDELLRFKRYGNPFSICMIDIDHFKKINDELGHQTGDIVLSELSGLIMSNIRNSDYFGRYGGEEFLLLLPETDQKTAAGVMENLRLIIERHEFEIAGSVTVSAGITSVNTEIKRTADLVEIADENLYKAKDGGRNQIYPAIK